VGEILRLMTPIAERSTHHDQRIVHRDLSRNIPAGCANLPYLTDFGLAKELTTRLGYALCVGHVDLYAAGAVFGGTLSTARPVQLWHYPVPVIHGQLPYEGKVAVGMRQIRLANECPT